MKISFLAFSMALLFGLSTSCSKDDTLVSTPPVGINGAWSLDNVSGGLMGANVKFSNGDVTWTFNSTNQTLVVQNNVGTSDPNYQFTDLASGSYSYTIQNIGGQQQLLINNNSRGVILTLNSTDLDIDEGVSVDGFIRKFRR